MTEIKTCKYCLDYKGDPKPILPEDMVGTIRMPDGSYKCHQCQTEEIQDKIIAVTPQSERAKEIIADRKREENKRIQFKNWEAKIMKRYGRLVRR
jgi:hypothetical protein